MKAGPYPGAGLHQGAMLFRIIGAVGTRAGDPRRGMIEGRSDGQSCERALRQLGAEGRARQGLDADAVSISTGSGRMIAVVATS